MTCVLRGRSLAFKKANNYSLGNQTMRKCKTGSFASRILLLLVSVLAACDKDLPSNVDAKISHDGSRIAVIRHKSSGTEMTVIDVDSPQIHSSRVVVPALTRSANFGNSKDDVLITYGERHKDTPYTMHLAGLSLKDPRHTVTEYASSDVYLAFPEQLDDGSILVMSGLYRTKDGYIPEKIWWLVRPGEQVRIVGDPWLGLGGPPRIVGAGFYEVEPVYRPPDAGPKLHGWALPSGAVPDVSRFLTKDTNDLSCTRNGSFCLRSQFFISSNGEYHGKLTALANGKECPVPGLPPRIDRVNVAANVPVAVVVVADDAYRPRTVNVLQFASNSCQLTRNIRVED